MSVELNLETITSTLKQYKSDVEGIISAKVKEQSDAATAQITELTGKLKTIDEGLETLKKSSAVKLGLPGIESEKQKWSWVRFFQAMYLSAAGGKIASVPQFSDPWGKCAPFEKEVCEQYAKRRNTEAIFGFEKKDFGADDGSSGGFIVPPEIYNGDIISTTYAQTPILNMPVMRLPNLMGDLPIPVDSGNLTAYWLGETAAPTKSDSSFGLKWLRPKKLGVFTKISNRLLASSNYAVEAIIRDKMSRDASVELSRGLTLGKGSENEPKGLLSNSGFTTATALGTNGTRFGIDDAIAMKQALAAANELRDTSSYGYLMRPEVYFGMLRERTAQYSGQAKREQAPVIPGSLLLDPTVLENALRAKLGSTTQIANNLVKGTSSTCSQVVYGDFSKFVFASFRDPIFRVSDVAADGSGGSAFLQDQLYLVMFLECDCQLLRASAFASLLDAETLESKW